MVECLTISWLKNKNSDDIIYIYYLICDVRKWFLNEEGRLQMNILEIISKSSFNLLSLAAADAPPATPPTIKPS